MLPLSTGTATGTGTGTETGPETGARINKHRSILMALGKEMGKDEMGKDEMGKDEMGKDVGKEVDKEAGKDVGREVGKEVRRRRTFAIISHPDAGKTTLTEKLLLFAGAIHIAGSVKDRKASRHATSDWMEIEKQRGISVASSVMQMVYREHVINLLDTPGHKDFSEDTYRVLTAVDSALMVIDAANGVEAQTRRLIEVCRQRNTPIITFINKMDREVRDPLDLLDEVERELGMPCVPMTWPVGQGKTFGGIMNLRTKAMTVFESGSERLPQDFETIPLSQRDTLIQRFGHEFETAAESMELAVGASPVWNHQAFLDAKQTPVFFGSGV